MASRCVSIATFAVLVSVLFAVPAAATEGGEMSPEVEAMMKKWMEYATPGEHHQYLVRRVGSWSFSTRMWDYPGADPVRSTGTSTARMIMDGRYLLDETEGSFQGMRFNGMGLMGYDNLNREYVALWIDNMGTGFMISRGTPDASGKVVTFAAESPDPLSGANKPFKVIERVVDEDTWVMEMYDTAPDGSEFLHFEITYERQP